VYAALSYLQRANAENVHFKGQRGTQRFRTDAISIIHPIFTPEEPLGKVREDAHD
jgi:hypothetical protein